MSGGLSRLIEEALGITSDLLGSMSAERSASGQFIAVVSKRNKFKDLGGISEAFSTRISSLTPLAEGKLVSVGSGEVQEHSSPIRSIKGGYVNLFGSLSLLLNDGTFLVGGGTSAERGGRGKLRRFDSLSGVKIKKVSAGNIHFLMLSEDGRVFSMIVKEKENTGQLGTGDTKSYHEPVEIKGIPRIRRVQAGVRASSLVDVNGDLWVCGNAKGFFPFQDGFTKPTMIERNVRRVFSGFDSKTTFIEKSDGRILAGGRNSNGQCGIGLRTTDRPYNHSEWSEIKFETPLKQGRVRKISSTFNASFLLLESGEVFSCGHRTENGFATSKARFAKIRTFEERGERILDLACGKFLATFLADSGRIYMAGYKDKILDTLEGFGKEVSGTPDERLWEISWRDEADMRKLKQKIDAGKDFKISIWQGVNPTIFVTERVPDRISSAQMQGALGNLSERLLEISQLTTELARENKDLKEKVESIIRENKDLKEKVESAVKENGNLREKVESAVKENGNLREKVESAVKENENLKEENSKMAEEVGKMRVRLSNALDSNRDLESLGRLRHLDVCLSPLKTLADLEKFLHFFDFSRSEKVANAHILELYKVPSKSTGGFSSAEQRAAVEKITDILKVRGMLRGLSHAELYCGDTSIRFDLVDQVYSDFFKCLNLSRKTLGRSKDSKILSEVSAALVSIFRYFKVYDFDLESLTLAVSTLEDSINEKLREVRKEISERFGTSKGVVAKIPSAGSKAVENYIKSFGNDDTFFKKFSFVFLQVLSAFIGSLSKELADQKTQTLLGGVVLRVIEYRWSELKSGKLAMEKSDRGKSAQGKLFDTLKSFYDMAIDIDNKIIRSNSRKELKEYRKQFEKIKTDLQASLMTFISCKIDDDNPSSDRILNELLGVFVDLKIIDRYENLNGDKILKILEDEFYVDFDQVLFGISRASVEASTSKEFRVIGFRNAEMDEAEVFYDPSGTLKRKYTRLPRVETHKGKPLSIFFKLYGKERVDASSIRVILVHLLSGESLRMNCIGCNGEIFITLKELHDLNSFELVISDLKYSGEFALHVSLRSNSSEPQEYFRRGIFNVFPQSSATGDF